MRGAAKGRAMTSPLSPHLRGARGVAHDDVVELDFTVLRPLLSGTRLVRQRHIRLGLDITEGLDAIDGRNARIDIGEAADHQREEEKDLEAVADCEAGARRRQRFPEADRKEARHKYEKAPEEIEAECEPDLRGSGFLGHTTGTKSARARLT